MTALIIDDITIARTIINKLTLEVGNLTIICKYCTAVEAYKHMQKKNMGLLFPNTNLANIETPELEDSVRKKDTIFVFITCSAEPKKQEIRPDLSDYLSDSQLPSKYLQPPVDDRIQDKKNDFSGGDLESVFIRDNSIIRRLKIDDIQYVEAMGDYVKLYTTKKMYTIHCTLKATEQRLSAANFIRVHRSYLVALNKLDSIQDGGLVIGDRFIPVADNYRKILHQRMNVL